MEFKSWRSLKWTWLIKQPKKFHFIKNLFGPPREVTLFPFSNRFLFLSSFGKPHLTLPISTITWSWTIIQRIPAFQFRPVVAFICRTAIVRTRVHFVTCGCFNAFSHTSAYCGLFGDFKIKFLRKIFILNFWKTTNQALISCIWTWHWIVARWVPARKASRNFHFFFNVNILNKN